MKNIHVLPTDKPSRLYKDGEKLKLDIESYGVNNQNIYITSDEEIKEGDWVCDIELNRVEKCQYSGTFRNWKKIILTTDPDLIADGVQAIDNEFLEWFVNNPSCENAYVEGLKTIYQKDWVYKIIIPQEESKKDEYTPQEEPKQETLEDAAERNCESITHPYCDREKSMFIKGANYQAKKSYSEEEVRDLILRFNDDKPGTFDASQWFDQNKKSL